MAVLEEREDGGAKSRQFFAIEEKTSSHTDSKLWRRVKYKNWSDVVSFGPTTGAATHTYKKLAVAGGRLITLHGTGVANTATYGSGHYVFSLDDITADPTLIHFDTTHTDEWWDENTQPEDIYVKSPTEIFFIGGKNATGGKARILKSSGALELPVQKGADGADTSCYYAIHGLSLIHI